MTHTPKIIRTLGTLLVVVGLFGGSSVLAPNRLHAASKSDVRVEPAKPVSINQAGSEELQAVKGIGPAIAERILQYRNEHGRFEKLEDLANVHGIGKAKLEKIKSQVSI